MNLEIELDWIDEESNLDETVKQQVIDSVVRKIQSGVESKVEKKINETIDATIVSKINEMTESVFNDFINKEVCLSDRYGDKIKCYPSLKDLLKERFDNFMTQQVDKNGKTTDSRYDSTFGRLEFIIDKQLKDFANQFTTDAVKKVSAEIQTHVKDGLTQKLGSELMKVLKVEKMLQISN